MRIAAFFMHEGTDAMQITVNGKTEIVSPCTILEFLEQKGLAPRAVIVEYNEKIAKRDVWSSTPLCEGDMLEVIALVGGG